MSRQRLGSIPLTISIRMCSLDKSVQGEHRRKTIPNRIHCSSSQAFEDVSKTLRTVAFVAEMMTTITMSKDKSLPRRKFRASIMWLSLSSTVNPSSIGWASGFSSG